MAKSQIYNRVEKFGWTKVMPITVQDGDEDLILFLVRWGKSGHLRYSETKPDFYNTGLLLLALPLIMMFRICILNLLAQGATSASGINNPRSW